MAQVFIPAPLRAQCGGAHHLQLEGRTVRELVARLDEQFPGVAARLTADDRLLPGLAVSIDGVVHSRGLSAPVEAESEVHFLPAIGGG